MTMRKTPLYYLLIWASLIAGLIFLVMLAPVLYSPEFILSDDFGHFWASGRLFIDQKNPYDLGLLFSAQVEAGAASTAATSIGSQTLNPPWTLLIFAPFSLLNYSLARILWLLINITLIVISIRVFWKFVGGKNHQLWLALLVTLCFTPTYSVLSKGQLTPWILLGITGFLLYIEGKTGAWWAGVCLVIVSTKPQLFYLLWPAFGLWTITKRDWKLLISGSVVGSVAILATLLVNNQVFSHYFNALREYPYDQWATPTVGAYIRFFWLGVDKFWIQYLPACVGLGWFAFVYLKKGKLWRWSEQIPALTLVSYLTSPYAWTYDAIIILPSMLAATNRLNVLHKTIRTSMWIIFIVINIANLLLHTKLSDFWFVWLAPSFAVWCLAVYLLYQQRMKAIT